MLQCCGRTWGEEAFLIKCDCLAHLMEIGYYIEDNSTKGYVQFFGMLYTKYKFSDMYFQNQEEFENFLELIKCMIDSKIKRREVFHSYGIIKGKKKILGRLEVEFDELNFLNFNFYRNEKPRKNEKVVWDICVRNVQDFNAIYNRCTEMLYSIYERSDKESS